MSMEVYKLFNNIIFTERCESYTTNYKVLKKLNAGLRGNDDFW
jgi:hypothetical protein